jgi:hypothetical protein
MIALTSGESTMTYLKLFVLGQPRLERGEAPVELNLRNALFEAIRTRQLVPPALDDQYHVTAVREAEP